VEVGGRIREMAGNQIRAVVESRAINGGRAIEVELEFVEGSRQVLECPIERASLLMHAITNAAVVAERMRKAAPGTSISTEVPYNATNVKVGTSVDERLVVLAFSTKEGPPMQVAMTPEIARTAIELLSNELDQLGRRPPWKTS
jgi:hypothetical protein